MCRRPSGIYKSPLHGGVDRNGDGFGLEQLANGRPFTGAWIETLSQRGSYEPPGRRPFTGAWIETPKSDPWLRPGEVAPSRGRGSKQQIAKSRRLTKSSPLHGGVDRNTTLTLAGCVTTSRPFTGAWIETCLLQCHRPRQTRRPFTGAWIETALPCRRARIVGCRPFTGAWIETPRGATRRRLCAVAPSRGRGSKRRQHK